MKGIALTVLLGILSFEVMANPPEVAANMSIVWGEVKSNTRGVMKIRIDDSQPYGGLWDATDAMVGKEVSFDCSHHCDNYAAGDYITGRAEYLGNAGKTGYTLRKITAAQKPSYLNY